MDEQQKHRYTKEQIMSFTMLLFFGIIIVVLGFLQVRNTIYTPFVIRQSDVDEEKNLALFEQSDVKLQAIDTDHDGINDYEELQFFGTSPYLEDSDSDGIKDKTEIDTKTDPLCPEGQRCNTAANPEQSASSTAFVPALGENAVAGVDGNLGLAPGSITDDLGNLSNNPAAMRELMLRSGTISKADLDQIDDATILQLAKELVAQRFGVNTQTNIISTTTSSTLQ